MSIPKLYSTYNPDDFQLNLTASLVEVNSTVAYMHCKKGLIWGKIASFMKDNYLNHTKLDTSGIQIKDTYGFSLNHFKYLQKPDLLKVFGQISHELRDLIENPATKEEYRRRYKFKFSKIDSLKKRQDMVSSIFKGTPDGDKIKGISLRRKTFLDVRKDVVRAAILDYDNNSAPYARPTQILQPLIDLNITFLAYSSFSSTNVHPKFRIIVPYANPITGWGHEKIMELLFYILDVSDDYLDIKKHRIDFSCIQPIRFFYVPNIRTDIIRTTDNLPHDDSAWFIDHQTGNFLDPKAVIKEVLIDQQIRTDIKIYSIALLKKIISDKK